jgi:hypothetical protein
MRMLRSLLGALLVLSLVGACDDGSSSSSEDEGTTSDDGGEATTDDAGSAADDATTGDGPDDVPDTEVTVDESQTCHNIQVQDGAGTSSSTQLVPVEADAPEGTEVVLEYSADREPTERVGRGGLGGEGTGVVYVPLYEVGERLTLEGATVGGAEAAIASGSEDELTVAPLTDPATTCDVSAQAG